MHYVYRHVCPDTGEVVYVGAGSAARAWICAKAKPGLRYGSREPSHADWLHALFARGFTMDQLVVVTHRGLSKIDAHKIEREEVRQLNPRFNQYSGGHNSKMTAEQVAWAKNVYGSEAYPSYKSIADKLNLTTTIVWRGMTGRTRRLK